MAKKTPAPAKAPKKPAKELNESQLDKAVGGGGRNPTTWGKPGGGN